MYPNGYKVLLILHERGGHGVLAKTITSTMPVEIYVQGGNISLPAGQYQLGLGSLVGNISRTEVCANEDLLRVFVEVSLEVLTACKDSGEWLPLPR